MNGNFYRAFSKLLTCHAEPFDFAQDKLREASRYANPETLRFAQGESNEPEIFALL